MAIFSTFIVEIKIFLNVTPLPIGGPYTSLQVNANFGEDYLIEFLFKSRPDEGIAPYIIGIDVNGTHIPGTIYIAEGRALGSPPSGITPTVAGQAILRLNPLDRVSLYMYAYLFVFNPAPVVAGDQVASISVKRLK